MACWMAGWMDGWMVDDGWTDGRHAPRTSSRHPDWTGLDRTGLDSPQSRTRAADWLWETSLWGQMYVSGQPAWIPPSGGGGARHHVEGAPTRAARRTQCVRMPGGHATYRMRASPATRRLRLLPSLAPAASSARTSARTKGEARPRDPSVSVAWTEIAGEGQADGQAPRLSSADPPARVRETPPGWPSQASLRFWAWRRNARGRAGSGENKPGEQGSRQLRDVSDHPPGPVI